jgi:hypothetical protein
LIRTGTYNEDTLIVKTPTSNVSAPVVIKPDAGATVVINVTPPSSATNFGIKIDSTSYVTIDGSNNGTTSRNMSIAAGGVNMQRGIWVEDLSTNTTLRNLSISTGGTTTSHYGIYLQGVTTGNPDNAVVENNLVKTAGTGIRAQGASSSLRMVNLLLKDNVVDSVSGTGIYPSSLASAAIRGNNISVPIGTSSVYGIILGDYGQVRCYDNRIHDLASNSSSASFYGVYMFGTAAVGGSAIFNNFFWNFTHPDAGTNNTYVIYHSTSNTAFTDTIAFNSVRLAGTSAGNKLSWCYWRQSTAGPAYVYNNIFHNTRTDGTTGVAYALGKGSISSAVVSDNNNLYVGSPDAQHQTGRIEGTGYASLADWQSANNSDILSFAESSPFVSATDLHVQTSIPTQVESAGIPLPGMNTDIDGVSRNATTPDVGADEFSGIAQDLTAPGILHTVLANTPSTAARSAKVTIADRSGIGAARLWHKASTGSSYSAVLPDSSSASNYYFTIPGYPQGTTVQYYLAAQDAAPITHVGTLPPGGSGINPPGSVAPPTTLSYFVQAPLSGQKTIGGTSPDFQTIKSALKALKGNGVAPPGVTFLIRSGTYTEDSLTISTTTSGASAPVTIRPDVGATVTIIGTGVGTSSGYVISVEDSTSYVTIDGSNNGTGSRNFTLLAGNSTVGGGISVYGQPHHITVKNCIINVAAGPIYSRNLWLRSSSAGGYYVVDNNVLQRGGFYGIQVSSTSPFTYLISSLTVSNNLIDSTSETGMEIDGVTSGSVFGNEVRFLNGSGEVAGIRIGQFTGSIRVYGNRVHDLATTSSSSSVFGVYVAGRDDMGGRQVVNNMVWNLTALSVGTNSISGIWIQAAGNTRPDTVAYNTVNLSGNSTGDKTTYAFRSPTTYPCYLYNNILKNTRTDGTTGTAYAIYNPAASPLFLTSNNNDVHVGTPDAQHVTGRLGTANYSTLAAWQAATGDDSQSVAIDPPFVSSTDLHIQITASTPLDAGGIPVAGIATDIDGNTRNTLTPDIGADEFVVATPQVSSARDVPNDQGGKVNLRWVASGLDTNVASLPFYSIWRALPQGAQAEGKQTAGKNITVDFKGPAWRTVTLNGTAYAWEWIANLPAHRYAQYAFAAPTLYDSSSRTNGRHYFLVSAHTNVPNVFYDSNVDSGYSVDNLPPLAPGNVSGSLVAGNAVLHWNPNTELDLNGYEVYRSSVSGFDPDTMTAYATTSDTTYTDTNVPTNRNSYYALRAIDVHENRSPKSNEVAIIVLSVGEQAEIPREFSLSQNYPNPFNPATQIKYGLPKEAFVTIKVFNVLGQEVRTLATEQQKAGYATITWDGRNNLNHPVGTGLYLYRIEAKPADGTEPFIQVKKMLMLK